MTTPSDHDVSPMIALAALAPADRRAVERLLSPEERRILRDHRKSDREHRNVSRAAPSTPARNDRLGYSALLSVRLMEIAAGRGDGSFEPVTEATREALKEIMARHSLSSTDGSKPK